MTDKNVIEAKETEVQEVKEESKIVSFFKKHGKKIAAGAAVVAAGVIGVVIGKKTSGETDEYYDDDAIEADFSEVDTNE